MSALDPRHALFPGSFDPPTLGHEDLLRRALALFDRVTLAVAEHPTKAGFLSFDRRVALLHELAESMDAAERLDVRRLDGLVVDGCRDVGAGVLLRGLRSGADFDYEAPMAGTNRAMAPEVETLFLAATPAVSHISSTLVRQIAGLGGDVSSLVSPTVLAALADLPAAGEA
ncbi:MAG: pantetheine-phosphate adenylyltransferase [Planctomycetota bacterium]|nr:pantetheine-phosphate adenylyltransferase [Planctomycetota bacterium]